MMKTVWGPSKGHCQSATSVSTQSDKPSIPDITRLFKVTKYAALTSRHTNIPHRLFIALDPSAINEHAAHYHGC